MLELDYMNMVRELCAATGIADWEEIARCGHICVQDTVVGLVHDAQHAPQTLGLYFELDDAPDRPDQLKALLGCNVSASPHTGRWGFMAETGKVVYRYDMPWTTDIAGSDLARLILDHAGIARQAMAGVSQA